MVENHKVLIEKPNKGISLINNIKVFKENFETTIVEISYLIILFRNCIDNIDCYINN